MTIVDLLEMSELEAFKAILNVDMHWDYVCFYEIDRDHIPKSAGIHLSVKIKDDVVVKVSIMKGSDEDWKETSVPGVIY